MTVDGVTNLDTGSNGSVHSMPSMDSVAELKVLSSNYGAEYGRNSGGTITVITKGGGRRFHGSDSWYYRHESLNADDIINNRAGRQRASYRYNINGYVISGPVIIPKMKSLGEKLFFFWSPQFQHQRVAYGTKTITIPTAIEHAGDFFLSFNTSFPNPKLITINDPLQSSHQAWPEYSKHFPQPNYIDGNPTNRYQYNYFVSDAGGYNWRTEILRINYQITLKWQAYFRLSNNADLRHAPYGFRVNGSVNFALTSIAFAQPGRGATLHFTSTISPTVFDEIILGVSQKTLTYDPDDLTKIDRTATGINIPQRNPSLNPLNIIPI